LIRNEKNMDWKATLVRRMLMKQPSNTIPPEFQLYLNQKPLWCWCDEQSHPTSFLRNTLISGLKLILIAQRFASHLIVKVKVLLFMIRCGFLNITKSDNELAAYQVMSGAG
jgi:hypothetical protein